MKPKLRPDLPGLVMLVCVNWGDGEWRGGWEGGCVLKQKRKADGNICAASLQIIVFLRGWDVSHMSTREADQ